eukprot:UN18437
MHLSINGLIVVKNTSKITENNDYEYSKELKRYPSNTSNDPLKVRPSNPKKKENENP